MKKYTWQIVGAAVLGISAAIFVWKIPAFVNAAFIISAAATGWLIAKRNASDAVDKFK